MKKPFFTVAVAIAIALVGMVSRAAAAALGYAFSVTEVHEHLAAGAGNAAGSPPRALVHRRGCVGPELKPDPQLLDYVQSVLTEVLLL